MSRVGPQSGRADLAEKVGDLVTKLLGLLAERRRHGLDTLCRGAFGVGRGGHAGDVTGYVLGAPGDELRIPRDLLRRRTLLLDGGSDRVAIWLTSPMDSSAARLLTLHAAHMMDTVGNTAARKQIALIEIGAPKVVLAALDRAIQVHGAMGVTPDTFLASACASARTLRIVDGPDAVHEETVSKLKIDLAASRALDRPKTVAA